MKYYVYILYSDSIDKYYIGYTSNLENRLQFHNSKEYNKIWSKRGIPWEMCFSHEFDSKQEAIKAEKRIKNQKSRAFIVKLIDKEITL